MAQPDPYVRFKTYSVPITPTDLNTEFNRIKATSDKTLVNLALIQRDDGDLHNGIVSPDALGPAVVKMMGSWNPRGAWVAGVAYSTKDFITQPAGNYIAVATHVSGDFAADLASGKWQLAASTASTPPTTAANFSALRVISSASSTVVVGGRTVAGDNGGGTFTVDSADTTSADNGGTIIVDGLNRRWKRVWSGRVDARWFGAKGDGSTPDGAAAAAAAAAVYALGGGTVYFPATGSRYIIDAGFTTLNGVSIEGDSAPCWNGISGSWATWSSAGTWFQPTDTVNPCITVAGVGTKIRGINFIHNQPNPSATPGTAYVPTVYPYCIRVTQNFVGIENVQIANGSHGIEYSYPQNTGGGAYCYINNLWSGCLQNDVHLKNLNDIIKLTNIHCRGLWWPTNSNIQTYRDNNNVGLWLEYVDNPMCDGIEFLECGKCIRLTDSNVTAGGLNITAATQLAQFSNIQFGACKQAVAIDTTTTRATMYFQNVTGQTDTYTNQAAGTFFDFGSDNIDVIMSNVWLQFVGNQIMNIGAGVGGKVLISNLRVDSFGSYAASTGFGVNTGAILALGGPRIVTKGAGASSIYAGAGDVRGGINEWTVFPSFSLVSGTCNGTDLTASVDHQMIPRQMHAMQARLVGNINITTAVALSTVSVKVSGFPTQLTAAVSSVSTGFKSFDTNWVDLPVGATALGRIMVNGTTGVAWQNGSVSVQFR